MNKRPRPAGSSGGWERLEGAPPAKRLRAANAGTIESPGVIASKPEPIATLSDEILVRILSFLSPQKLLAIATVSRRFERLCSDSQLWKSAYYARFVLPRAMRIPGFRHGHGAGPADAARNHKLHYKGRQALWADGSRGGLVRNSGRPPSTARGVSAEAPREREDRRVDWKRQYKIRHNWARGKCAVEELNLAPGVGVAGGKDGGKMLAKVIEGVAITVDKASGLRAWNLKTRQLLAQASIAHVDQAVSPTCLAIDDQHLDEQALGIAIGFSDGSFSTWLLDCRAEVLRQRYRHEQSSNGELVSMAYLHPYLLTATGSVLASLYTFEGPSSGPGSQPASSSAAKETEMTEEPAAPYLLTSLRSHTARSPMSLSIRRLPSVAVASIAYVFSTRQGWSIGMQELHIKDPPPGLRAAPDVTTTRLVYTGHVYEGTSARVFSSSQRASPPPLVDEGATDSPELEELGPTTLCYTHPYLLATLPDNTLILHVCTSTAAALSISPGIRLWGHTSGISDAEITARGRAVSVSSRGQEMRVWELEGKQAASHGRSVEIRPDGQESLAWDEQRNWVGFDDEMVIVLKESRDGQESLMVYDFT